MSGSNAEIVKCYQCIYFQVTWDISNPKSCKMFGFKTRRLPSDVVYEYTGTACLGFEPKDVFVDKKKLPPPKYYG